MIYPEFSEFRRLALENQNKRLIPVSLEMEGDLDTPISLFKKLCHEDNSYLLESVEGGEKWARYSYIGRKPLLEITASKDQVFIKEGMRSTTKQGDVLKIIEEVMEDFQTVSLENLPDFSGGAVGYIGYDLIRNYETLGNESFDQLNMPDIHLLLTTEVIAFDHLHQKIKILVNIKPTKDLEEAYRQGVDTLKKIKEEIDKGKHFETSRKGAVAAEGKQESNETQESFMAKVSKAQEYIKNGDIFQVVLSKRISMETNLDPFEAYRLLRSINPSPYLFYINYGKYQLVGSSPELLVKVKAGQVETCPIAGTRPRGKDEIEDALLAKELLADEKELAEHLMLVDLGRNDIGKISDFGSVKVTRLMEIEKYSHVMHIVSYVEGRLQSGATIYDAIKACLPAGTLSGAPKVRAMEIIDELENTKRGVYGGAFGYLGFNGNMDLCIAIRTMVFKDQKVHLQAGAGIVADSQPELEHEEALRKMRALIEAIRRAELS